MELDVANQPGAGAQSTWSRPGFQNAAKIMVDRSDLKVEIIFLVPNDAVGQNLPALLRDAGTKGEQVFYTISPARQHNLRKLFQKDIDVAKLYRLFRLIKHVPFNLTDFKYHEWQTRLMVPHLIMSTCRYTWNGATPTLLLQHGYNSLTSELIRLYWRDFGDIIRNDINNIMANPEKLFCSSCSNQCPFHMQPYHFSLDKFNPVVFSKHLTSNKMLTKLRLFGCLKPLGCKTLARLHEAHNRIDMFSATAVNSVLQEIDTSSASDAKYCCYMICVLVGPSMAVENEDDHPFSIVINELLKDANVYKFLYVGMSIGNTFRESHLTETKSPIFRVLTKHARLFILRRFVSNSREEVGRNEAFIIELLKKTIKRNIEMCVNTNYLLLNILSGPSALLGADETTASAMLDSIDKNLCIFSGTSTRPDLTYDSAFTGDYGFNNEYEIPEDSPCKEKEFEDVKEFIDNVVVRNMDATFINIRN